MYLKFYFIFRIINVMVKYKVRVKENIICYLFFC